MIELTEDALLLSGRLTMSTVPALYESGLKVLSEKDLQVDMSRVETVDSAAVSMLLGWSRAAQARQGALRVTGIPASLLTLANLYGVADMLPN
ncbi:MAG TPA: anti-sigma-factor [Gallionella sp.]|nr:STAS domain-containing protein [Gallionella sp.]HCI52924.1 anti-sigma-factor [Gallionella sp.]